MHIQSKSLFLRVRDSLLKNINWIHRSNFIHLISVYVNLTAAFSIIPILALKPTVSSTKENSSMIKNKSLKLDLYDLYMCYINCRIIK